jgi:hypothetical protein
MPKALERKLAKQASSQGLTGAHRDAYIYGTLRKTGWKPKRERQSSAVKALRSKT